jgi:predicted CoA-binding protein
VAVVGYSNKPDRPSHEVTEALKAAGYDVYPVNPTLPSTETERIYATLNDIPALIDIVDIFRRPEDVPEVVEAAIAVGAKAVWMQLGIVNEAAAKRAEEAGLTVVMDRCMKVERRRLLP